MGDPAEKAIEKIVKQLPVKQIYEDGLSGATKQVGHSLTDVVKSIRLALFPLQFLAAFQDRVEKFIDRAVRRIPEQHRISPAPQVIGPVLEGIRYEPEGTPIDEMFSELLSRSMDSERVNEAHPAYPVLIRQLSEDEAKVLKSLDQQQFDYVFTRDYNASTALFSSMKVEVDDLPRDGLTFPENIPFYFQHLDKLGLAAILQQGNQEPIFNSSRTQIGVRVRCKYTLTEFGQRFVRACVGVPTHG
jgi:Abortive infection alpha